MPCPLRGAAGSFPARQPGRLGLAGLAAGVPRSRQRRRWKNSPRNNAAAVEFFAWLQWLADEQLAALGLQSWRRGLGIGLYQDLALGVNPGGSEVWAWQDVFATGAYAGAPPDDFNLLGQDWGLPPLVPHRLREAAYAPFIAMLRANMRHCGALRIDHVMALARLFWVPAGMAATQGAYVAYPLDDLLGILALESQRNHCMVIGEDLGTVPDGFRSQLAAAGVLSYHPFLFERTADGSFKPPADYPRQALVAVSTHDLPTLRGFWNGHDLDLRNALKLLPSEEQRGNLVHGAFAGPRPYPDGPGARRPAARRASASTRFPCPRSRRPSCSPSTAYLARTPAQLLVVQPEDILGLVEQVNLPGSRDDQHPNWRRRLPLDLEDWPDDDRFAALGEADAPRARQRRGTPPRRSAARPRGGHPARHLPDSVQPRLHLRAGHGTGALPGRTRRQPLLRLALSAGATRQQPRLRHRRPRCPNPEIGTPQEFEDFVAALKAHELGQILDVVPNHMGVMGADNALVAGRAGKRPGLGLGRLLRHRLGAAQPRPRAARCCCRCSATTTAPCSTAANCASTTTPHAASSACSISSTACRSIRRPIPRIVGHRSEQLAAALGGTTIAIVELQTLLTTFGHLPARTDTTPERMAERQRDKEVHKRHLASLSASCPDIGRHIADNLAEFNGRAGDPASFDLLHELIKLQGYRLAFWRVASDEINYRRFFDINDLAALRMEEPAVFEATHRFVLDLLATGKVDGLRIDHPDGLYDPGRYFRRLQAGGRRQASRAGRTPAAVPGDRKDSRRP